MKRIEKDSEKFATVEEVFDHSTVFSAYKLIRKGVLDRFNGVVSTGKESRIYLAFDKNENLYAVKIYLTTSAEFKKGMQKYLDLEELKIYRRSFRLAVFEWCKKEYNHLKIAYEAGVKVPKPITYINNILVLEFIGDEGKPAPLLAETNLPNYTETYEKIINYIEVLYKVGIIHADLSEYNILIHNGEPYLIDFGQSVKKNHPNSLIFLLRDIKNINKFFKQKQVQIIGDLKLFNKIIG
ncbi:MAG: serine protein kinase RIO [Thermoproteota archaeon]